MLAGWTAIDRLSHEKERDDLRFRRKIPLQWPKQQATGPTLRHAGLPSSTGFRGPSRGCGTMRFYDRLVTVFPSLFLFPSFSIYFCTVYPFFKNALNKSWIYRPRKILEDETLDYPFLLSSFQYPLITRILFMCIRRRTRGTAMKSETRMDTWRLRRILNRVSIGLPRETVPP